MAPNFHKQAPNSETPVKGRSIVAFHFITLRKPPFLDAEKRSIKQFQCPNR